MGPWKGDIASQGLSLLICQMRKIAHISLELRKIANDEEK